MIQLTNFQGKPLFVQPEQIAAFGPREDNAGEIEGVKSYIVLKGRSDRWALQTEFDELQRLILEASAPSCCKSSGIEYL